MEYRRDKGSSLDVGFRVFVADVVSKMWRRSTGCVGRAGHDPHVTHAYMPTGQGTERRVRRARKSGRTAARVGRVSPAGSPRLQSRPL